MCKEYIAIVYNLSEKALKAIEDTYGYSGKWKNETQKEVDIFLERC